MRNLLLAVLLVMSMGVYAQGSVTDKGYIHPYEVYSEDGVLFTKQNSQVVLVKFPQNKNLVSYTVPDGVKIIAKGAFQGNKFIYDLKIPASVEFIGEDAFNDCVNLRSIEVYDSSSGVRAAEADSSPSEIREVGHYNIQGVKIEEDENGQVQIILYSDGTVKKVIQ